MGMENPLPTFTSFVERIRAAHPNLAYVHVVEPRVHGDGDLSNPGIIPSSEALRKAAGDIPYIAAGGFDRTLAASTVEKHGGLIAFGRHFLANVSNLLWGLQTDPHTDMILPQPDLPLRLKEGLSLTRYNRDTFYVPEAATGYIDYPFVNEVDPLKA
jgi:NADPH2 dehydrogenase